MPGTNPWKSNSPFSPVVLDSPCSGRTGPRSVQTAPARASPFSLTTSPFRFCVAGKARGTEARQSAARKLRIYATCRVVRSGLMNRPSSYCTLCFCFVCRSGHYGTALTRLSICEHSGKLACAAFRTASRGTPKHCLESTYCPTLITVARLPLACCQCGCGARPAGAYRVAGSPARRDGESGGGRSGHPA